MPSPVVASSRSTRWPDCSPPSTRPCSSSASSTLRSPTGVSTTSMPCTASARAQPEVRHHRGHDRVARAAGRDRGRSIAMIGEHLVAVDEPALFVDGDDAVGVTVEREPERRRRARRRAPAAPRDTVEPHPVVDVLAVRLDVAARRPSAPSCSSARGATRYAAPLPAVDHDAPAPERRRAQRGREVIDVVTLGVGPGRDAPAGPGVGIPAGEPGAPCAPRARASTRASASRRACGRRPRRT